ncbi:hypothetical protein ID858_06855 [Xenorhabdus sp. DI]|uniref:hypothetical protein n=1 Tax=Xenorhabdus doucetiae TaxID=351671 RepID=UPI001999E27B|nr:MULTISPECIES: hypothetical protein [unclassified Xenorhabdus]MBD2786251.1 hypothetical protein [Xenorhabdus sp. 3]MBD2788223.1 hypothetical protein [Xenorhabdus sp. DI]
MGSGNQNMTYNVELVQKYNIVDSYSVKYVHKKCVNHTLLTGYFDDGEVYSLYVRNGDRMLLVDTFKKLNEANQQAQAIVDNHQELKKYLISQQGKCKS